MPVFRNLGGLALGSVLLLGACGGQDRPLDARTSQTRPGTPVMQDPLNAGTPGVGVNDRVGGPGSLPGAALVPGGPGSGASAGGLGGAGRSTQGFGAPLR